jgi:hypothetical protein
LKQFSPAISILRLQFPGISWISWISLISILGLISIFGAEEKLMYKVNEWVIAQNRL